MQDQKPGESNEVNEALDETFPASDPASYATPDAEHQNASKRSRRITPGTWVMVAIAVLLFIALISMAF